MKTYDFTFVAIVFGKQAVGEELGGVADHASCCYVKIDPAALNSDLFLETYITGCHCKS